ncbi:MAG: hypothetical protein MO846_09740 [Candidatus Devosia symbiotica]|nr:hypothetical protein [Candidatus Devosia symbiotica]
MDDKIEAENVGQPGKTYRVDAAKYEAMRDAMLKVLPEVSPGMPVAVAIDAVTSHLPQDLFLGGDIAGWRVKCAQLDLKAKQIIACTPLSVRLYRLSSGN